MRCKFCDKETNGLFCNTYCSRKYAIFLKRVRYGNKGTSEADKMRNEKYDEELKLLEQTAR